MWWSCVQVSSVGLTRVRDDARWRDTGDGSGTVQLFLAFPLRALLRPREPSTRVSDHCLRAAVRGRLITDPGRTRHLKDIGIPWSR